MQVPQLIVGYIWEDMRTNLHFSRSSVVILIWAEYT